MKDTATTRRFFTTGDLADATGKPDHWVKYHLRQMGSRPALTAGIVRLFDRNTLAKLRKQAKR